MESSSPAPASRVILHVDLDAFYASVEQRDRPSLRGRPVVVGGSVRRGVVSAASYEARRYGIRSAMPMAEAVRRCPELVVLPGRMRHYVAVSRRVREIFGRFTPQIEPISLDEAFLDVTGSVRLFGDGTAIARAIKDAIRGELGLTASAGVAANKLVAKIASDRDKPDGLTVVPPGEEAAFLAPLPIEALWGVGPRTASRLRARGLRTIGDLQCRVPPGAPAGSPANRPAVDGIEGALLARALGIDDRPVVVEHEVKSVSAEHTFDEDVEDGETLRREIRRQAESVARRLRSADLAARTVTLKIRAGRRRNDGRYPLTTRSHTRDEATDDGAVIFREAEALWRHLEPRPARIRLVGVGVSGFDRGARQGRLFGERAREERRRLHDAVDRIATRFGERSIGPASTLEPRPPEV